MFQPSKRTDSYSSDAGASSQETIIARGVRVEGEFTSPGNVLIEGEVQGHVTAKGVLTVGTEAKLKADVSANEAIISGSIEGNVVVTKRMELKASAKVMGDVTCETASIEAGAVLNGKVSIGVAVKSPSNNAKPAHAATP